jgi:hypothetical protein
MEPLYGSASPMWAAPSAGFAVQAPGSVGNGPIAGPIFGASPVTAFAGSVSPGVQNVPPAITPSTSYGYGASVVTIAPPIPAGLTASSLLTAIALRRGQPQGPANDQEAEEFIYDALELLPGAADVEVRCDGGRATLTGSVPHKRVKHDVGEIAWAIPALNDVQNNVTIASRRRARGPNREAEPQGGAGRKQA